MTEILNNTQWQTLQAAVDRIIPADDYPSGWEAGVGNFFARLLEREPRFLPVYQAGLDTMETETQAGAGKSFAGLDPERQDQALTRMETGEGAAFFRLLVEQTMEGFYADPGNGGNKDGVAWEMIGYRVTA